MPTRDGAHRSRVIHTPALLPRAHSVGTLTDTIVTLGPSLPYFEYLDVSSAQVGASPTIIPRASPQESRR